MEIREVVCIAIVNEKGEILIQKRDEKSSKWGEEWSFFGGGIETGETPEIALQREAKEELGMSFGAGEFSFVGNTYRYSEKVGKYYIRHIYLIRTLKAEAEFIDQEGAGARFIPLEEIGKLLFVTPVETEIFLIKKGYEEPQ